MTNRILPAPLALLLAFAAATSCKHTEVSGAHGAPVDRRAEEAALRAADHAWAEMGRTGDVEGLLSFMADDGETLAPNEPLAKDKAAIRASWKNLFALPGVSLTWHPVRVEVAESGELGFARGTYTLSFTGPDGKPVRDVGKYCEVWKKIDGRWKCLIDAYNFDLPLP